MLPFNYHHLYYFYTVAEEGSVSAASKKLRLAQPTLSAQIKNFEDYLEKKLFLREGRKLLLTEDGHHVLVYAKTIFDLGREMFDSLEDRTRKGLIRVQVGISNCVPKAVADTLLKHIYKIYPDVYVTVIEENMAELMESLRIHKLDMVLSDLPIQRPSEEGFENHLLARLPVVLCANKSIAKKIRRIPADLNRFPVIMPTAQSQTYHALQEYFLSHKVTPRVIGEVQDIELVRRLVLDGVAIAPMNIHTVKNAPLHEKIEVIRRGGKLPVFESIYLMRRTRKYAHPIVQAILKNFRL